MMRLSLLGSTGSIGTQALEVVRNLRAQGEEVQVVALAARSSVQVLEAQARELRPAVVAVFEAAAARSLRESLADTGLPVLAGMGGLGQAAGAGRRHPGAGPASPQLGHGRENHHRFRHTDEQGPGGHRSLLAL